MTRLKLGLFVSVMALLSIAFVPAQAQDEIALTLAIADFNEGTFRYVADQFEAQNPGVRVYLESYGDFGDAISGQGEIDDYLDEVEELVSSADVVPISNTLYPEATRAGYLLDLAPLANSDATLNSADFYPALWDSFQWDGGLWGIPVAGSISALYYDPIAFDEAGVPYPNENWTLADFDSAVRALTQYNADGSVATPGFLNFGADLHALFVSLLGGGIADDTLFSSAPNYDNPVLEDLLTTWANLQSEGLINFPASDEFDFNNVPMMAGSSFLAGGGDGRGAVTIVGGGNSEPPERFPAPFPGGRVGLNASGYGVSSGTLNPELAYELATFLSNSPEIVGTLFNAGLSARRSSVGAEGEDVGGGIRFEQASSTEIDAFNQVAIESAISSSELRFMTQIEDAVDNMVSNGVDAPTALDDLEVAVLARLQVADERALTTQVAVTPPAITTLAEGEIALNFGLSGFVPNEDQWQNFADEFATQDPEIGAILIDSVVGFGGNQLSDMVETYDCFYQDTNIIPNADLTLLRNIDPLLWTDPTFNPNDIVTGVIAQLQLNGQTWGYPLNIQPLVMRYNPDIFAQAGAFAPNGTWSVAEFEDALRTVGNFFGADVTPFQPQAFDNAYLLNLIASYGGLPIDTRTTPATYNFTDPANVEAIRQVLDLAVNGFMDYSELATVGGRFEFTIGGGEDGENPVPIYTETLNGFGFGGGGVFIVGGGDFDFPENTDLMVTFPTGSQFNAVSYDIGTAYISALTQYTDPCYRFISALGQNPDLFPSMPTNRTLINTPDFITAQGQNAVNFYNSLDNLLSQSNTIALPTFGGQGGIDLGSFWLNRIFDQYVAGELQELEPALAEAEGFTRAYQECVANIPPFDPASGENPRAFFGQITECASQVDPTAVDFFPTFGN